MAKILLTVPIFALLCANQIQAAGIADTGVLTALSDLMEIACVCGVLGLAMATATMGMSLPKKAACTAGFIACGFLVFFNWLTSVDGATQVLGQGHGIISDLFPVVFATMTTCVNTLAGYFFAMFKRNNFQFSDWSSGSLMVMVICCLVYEITSSVIGCFSIYSGIMIETMLALQEATEIMGGMRTCACLLIAGLFSMSPFLLGVFGDALKSASEASPSTS